MPVCVQCTFYYFYLHSLSACARARVCACYCLWLLATFFHYCFAVLSALIYEKKCCLMCAIASTESAIKSSSLMWNSLHFSSSFIIGNFYIVQWKFSHNFKAQHSLMMTDTHTHTQSIMRLRQLEICCIHIVVDPRATKNNTVLHFIVNKNANIYKFNK